MGELRPIQPGIEVAGFRIGEKIYQGGMAELYEASGQGPDRLLLKVPRLGLGEHPACYVGFEAEQMILATLAGPHVPRLVASGECEYGPYIVMERIAGASLEGILERSPLPLDEVRTLGERIASALQALHYQDVVHHDLRPGNVLLKPGGEVVLVDYGLAFSAHHPDLVEEQFHLPLGAAAYLSPEQVRGHRGDPRSDLFALGVLLYALACGRLPFGTPATVAGMRRRLHFEPQPPRSIRPDLPDWFQEIVLRCLEPRAADRYPTAAQVAYDLRHPDQVSVTERGRKLQRSGTVRALARWLGALWSREPEANAAPSAHLARAPHVLAAIDANDPDEALAQAQREAVRRVISVDAQVLLTCLNVLEPPLGGVAEGDESLERSLHTERLMQLHHWAQPLALPTGRVRFHVLVGSDAAAAILRYARAAHADLIILGARGSSGLRRYMGSVSSQVVAEASCSVTVVRPRSEKAGRIN